MTRLRYVDLGKKTLTDFDGNEIEYDGELDEMDRACGLGVSTRIERHGIVQYKGTFLDD